MLINVDKAKIWLESEGYSEFSNSNGFLIAKSPSGLTQTIRVRAIHPTNGRWYFKYAGVDQDRAHGVRPLFVYKQYVGWNRDYFPPAEEAYREENPEWKIALKGVEVDPS